ncbi:MAG: ketoacyl-ACP synthase III [Oscillospiraceae bacterium]|nr:ketoacyl-ACP synthase III [Oscillospiraceae bacterium]
MAIVYGDRAHNVHLTGTGRFLPPGVITNGELSRMVDTSDEWIVSHTGIRTRHIARGLSVTDMAVGAARAALECAGLAPQDIGVVVATTVTPERRLPSLACDVQANLGIANAFCVDINASCTGFIYAVDIVARYLATGGAKHALVVSAEKLTDIMDFTDRTTCILFGDGAGAAVFTASDEPGGLLGSYLAARGDGGAALRCRWDGCIEMDGHEVFRFAVRALPEAVGKAMALSGRDLSELAYAIPHQANRRIIDAAMRRCGIPPDKVAVTVDRHGNTSSASIPIALDELNRDGRLRPGDLVVLVGFGAGLTYGAVVLEVSD